MYKGTINDTEARKIASIVIRQFESPESRDIRNKMCKIGDAVFKRCKVDFSGMDLTEVSEIDIRFGQDIIGMPLSEPVKIVKGIKFLATEKQFNDAQELSKSIKGITIKEREELYVKIYQAVNGQDIPFVLGAWPELALVVLGCLEEGHEKETKFDEIRNIINAL